MKPSRPKSAYQFAVVDASGGAQTDEKHNPAFSIGATIGKTNHRLLTSATVGLPDRVAQGAKSVGGVTVGISPAATKQEHTKKYRQPTESYDVIMYSGMHYVSRDIMLVSSADAVIFIGEQLRTLHELTAAMELHKPIGVLLSDASADTAVFDDVMRAAGSRDVLAHNMVFEAEPKRLLRRLEELLAQ